LLKLTATSYVYCRVLALTSVYGYFYVAMIVLSTTILFKFVSLNYLSFTKNEHYCNFYRPTRFLVF